MDDNERSARRVGTTLKGRWVLERLIGVGGMATVYAARHKIGRFDAIKILHPEIARSSQLVARFEQEAHAVNRFRHRGVVEIRDVDTSDEGEPFLVMELLEGESLAERTRREPPLALDDVLRIADETLDVLAAAHREGIIHRDIKPDNLFLTRDGTVKVLDFGIARVRSGADAVLKTKTGTTLGTVSYMPSEQARGLDIDPRADVYAVGATMFRLLAKRRVHEAGTEVELLMKVVSDPAPPLASVTPTVPQHVCSVVDRALAYRREDRYPDAATMQADVRAVRQGLAPPYASSASPLPTAVPTGAPSSPGPSSPGSRDAPTVAPQRTPDVAAPQPSRAFQEPTAAPPHATMAAPSVTPRGAEAPSHASELPTRVVASTDPTSVAAVSARSDFQAGAITQKPRRANPMLIAGGVAALLLLLVAGAGIAWLAASRASGGAVASPSAESRDALRAPEGSSSPRSAGDGPAVRSATPPTSPRLMPQARPANVPAIDDQEPTKRRKKRGKE